jgi:P pilus assembly chaperone PapD
MDVQPTINVINLPRDAGGIRIAVRNPRNLQLPVSFEIFERKVNPDGTEEQKPADDLFTIFPAQAVIPPGRTQAVRIQWVGGATDKSRSFTFYSAEVPVNLDGQQSGVQRILRIGASVHVAHTNAKPQPILEASAPEADGVKVTVRNDGQRFLYVDSLALTFGDKTVAGTALADMAGRTLIPPGAKREFVVKGVSGQPSLKLLPDTL